MTDALLETVEHGPADANYSIIWMHGLGADAHDFDPLVPELGVSDKSVRFVFPNAPYRPVTINAGATIRAWFDVYTLDKGGREDGPGIRACATQIEALIKRENDRGVPTGNIILAGFSQGAAMALFTGTRYPEPLLGIVALSSFLVQADTQAAEESDANRATPIFMAHGILDSSVIPEIGEASANHLKELGHPVQYKEYEMWHHICREEVDDLKAWLGERIPN